MRANSALFFAIGITASVGLGWGVAQAQPQGQPLPDGIRWGSEIVPEDGVEIRTYQFEETQEQLPYAVFVSSKIRSGEKAPLILALRGFSCKL